MARLILGDGSATQMTAPDFDPWSDVLVAEIAAQKIRAPQYGLRGKPVTREERTAQRKAIEDLK